MIIKSCTFLSVSLFCASFGFKQIHVCVFMLLFPYTCSLPLRAFMLLIFSTQKSHNDSFAVNLSICRSTTLCYVVFPFFVYLSTCRPPILPSLNCLPVDMSTCVQCCPLTVYVSTCPSVDRPPV